MTGNDKFHGALRFHPWVFLVLFVLGHSLLSFAPLDPAVRMAVGLFTLALPLAIGFLIVRDSTAVDRDTAVLSPPSRVLWAIFVASLLFTQLFRIQSNPPWLIMDDGRELFFGLQVSRHWEWRMQWGEGQTQPLYFWMLGLLFKGVTPSLLIYRLIPAVLFMAAVGAAYWGSLGFFPRGRAFLVSVFTAFSFFPYVLSRQPQSSVLMLAAEFLVFGLLARILRDDTRSTRRAALLGLVAGLGTYTYTSWPTVAFWAGVVLLGAAVMGRPRLWKPLAVYAGTTALVVAPLAAAYLAPHGTDYFLSRYVPGRWGIPYLEALFWNGYPSAPYGPAWGGLFNPLSGALLFLGILHAYRERRLGWGIAALAAVPIFILPALLTDDVQMLRVLQLLPLGLAFCAAGLESMVPTLPSRYS